MATDILNIAEVEASQSQKEVTINEAINDLALATNDNVDITIVDAVQTVITNVDPTFIFDRNYVFTLVDDGSTPPTGAYTVELQATRRIFAIVNNSSFEATIEVDPASDGADGTTVAVPAGENRIIYSDGTDLVSLGGGSGGGGSSTYLGLSDTPGSFSGDQFKTPRINSAEDAIEFVTIPAVLALAVSDETNVLTTGTDKITYRMPYAMTVTEVRASLSTGSTAGTVTVDINENGSTILSTKLTIDATETTSTTAASPAVISDAVLADDAEITIDVDDAGSSADAIGLKVYLIGRVT